MRRLDSAKLHLLNVRQVQYLGDGYYADGGGLHIRVRDGFATFVFRYTGPDGKRHEMGLGTVYRGSSAQAGESLRSARDLAAQARHQLRQGIDPAKARKERVLAAQAEAERAKALREREEETLARVARRYHKETIEPKRSHRHGLEWIGSLERHVPAEIWHAPIASVTAPQLRDFLLELSKKVPETATRVRQRLDAIFDEAVFQGLCQTNVAAVTRRKLQDARVRQEVQHLRKPDYEAVPALMQRVRSAEGTAARCLEFTVLTAARTGESIAAQWNEFDLERGVWTVPKARMKAKKPHEVFLSDRAVEIVRGQIGQHERFLFPSPMLSKKDKHISNIAMLALLSRLKLRKETTVHGLARGTFTVWSNEVNAARLDVIELCLAHTLAGDDKVRAAYIAGAKFAAERRALMQAWADYLTKPAKLRAVAKAA